MAQRDLSTMRVLVTGGSSGIGLCTAIALGHAGARVVLLARGDEGLADAATQVPGNPGIVRADVSRSGEALRGVQEAAALLGGLDAVVAAAGSGAYGPFLEMDPEDVERTISTTLLGLVHTAQASLPELTLSEGTLVVIGSVAGRVPVPWLAAYSAAKHGVRGFVRSLDAELRAQRRPVRLALVAPGPVDTPFWARAPTPDRRLPPQIRGAYRAQDVAQEVLVALRRPGRLERTVGAAMLAPVYIDALVPNLVQAPMGLLARLGWRDRGSHPRSDDDGLREPVTVARVGGGLSSRPSLRGIARRLRASP